MPIKYWPLQKVAGFSYRARLGLFLLLLGHLEYDISHTVKNPVCPQRGYLPGINFGTQAQP